MAGAGVTEASLHATAIAMLLLTSLVFVARVSSTVHEWRAGRPVIVPQWWREIHIEDFWLLLCYLFFVAVAILYMYIVPAFFRLTELGEGLIAPYATAEADALFIQKGLFCASASLWFCLWSAKFSLLCMYKKLFDKLPFYIRLWWGVVVFTALALVGCIVTLFEACENMHNWFSAGACVTERDIIHASISLWYAYAVDLLTDLLIMALPLRLLIGLQMPLSRKLSIACLFCLGFVCMIASTIRATQVNNGALQPTVPWLALWGTVEAATAVVISNSPGLYRMIKRQTSRRKYYANGLGGYENTGDSKSGDNRSRSRNLGGSMPGGTIGGTSSRFPGGSRNRGTVDDEYVDEVELKSYGNDTASGGSNSPTGASGAVAGKVYRPDGSTASRADDPNNSSQEGLVEDLRRANGGVVNVNVTSGSNNRSSKNTKGIVVTNTHVLQRSNDPSYGV